MNNKLEIHESNRSCGSRTMRITGFNREELIEFKLMTYQEMEKDVLDALDIRNNGLGTQWHNGYGVYQMWIAGDSVFVDIGDSCD